MREIKFRAWDKEDKEMMCLGEALKRDWVSCDEQDYYLRSEYPDEVVLMQFTGLKDKNGVEIYEGDKLSFTVFDPFDNDTQYTGYVVYTGSRFQIWNKPDDEYYGSDGGFELDLVVNQDDEIEIIGNIYENPELLGENK